MDGFKEINDSFGHITGSSVLHHTGKIIRRTVGEQGECFRYGGDEFIVLLKGKSLEEGIDLARRIKEEIKKLGQKAQLLFDFEDMDREEIPLSCSIGISTYTRDIDKSLPIKEKVKNLIKSADNYMYIAKARGKDTIAYSSDSEG